MKAGLILALVLAGPLAGCASGQGGLNPNLLAPKAVVQTRPDGNLSVFVHGAFQEHLYDWIAVTLDNGTTDNRSWVFSSETVTPPRVFVNVTALAGDVLYRDRVSLDAQNVAEDRLRVAVLPETGVWGDARVVSLPYERILDRPKVSP